MRQCLDYAEAVDAPRHHQRQARTTMFVDQPEVAQAAPIANLTLNEVEAPDVVAKERP